MAADSAKRDTLRRVGATLSHTDTHLTISAMRNGHAVVALSMAFAAALSRGIREILLH